MALVMADRDGDANAKGQSEGQLAYASAGTLPLASLTPRLRLAVLWASATIGIHFLISCLFWSGFARVLTRRFLSTPSPAAWVPLAQAMLAVALLTLSISAWRKARKWRREAAHTLLLCIAMAALLYAVEHTFQLCQVRFDPGGPLYFNSWLLNL